MSFIIKGFATINSMLDGGLNVIAPLGELSTYSRTFSTVKTTIAKHAYESVSVEVFSCKEDGINKNMPNGTDEYILQRLEDILDNFVNGLTFEEQFGSRYPSDVLVHSTPLIEYGGKSLPGMIRWNTTVAGEPVTFAIWFSDATFRETYDEHEIRILPPIPNPNDLNASYANMLAMLEDYDYSAKMVDIEEIRDGDPATKIATLKLRWVDPVSDFSTELVWTLVTYGASGLIYENQIQAIRAFLIANTTLSINDWLPYFPDLVIHTTISIVPLWDNVALRSSGSVDYVLSPMVKHTDIARAAAVKLGVSPVEVNLSEVTYAVSQYKSMGFVVITEDNSTQDSEFGELYPDYAIIPINDINLNRLADNTKQAIIAMEKGLRIAETDDGIMALPVNHSRLLVGGVTYITYTTNGVTHRIVTKQSYLANVS
jgi:hypothetical protein